MTNNVFKIPNRSPARNSAPCGKFPQAMRLSGHVLSLVSEIGDLEECLALERSRAFSTGSSPVEGIHSPPAVPYCDFLMLRDAFGRLQAVSRLMKLERDMPMRNPLDSGRFHLSPLLTALRYSREGILEMGNPAFAKGCDQAKAAGLLWAGMVRYLERNHLHFVIGQDSLSMHTEVIQALPNLMETHGLHPDLAVEARSAYASSLVPAALAEAGAAIGPSHRNWPASLREALARGCRLAGEPAYNAAAGCLEFIWVASLDMLVEGETGDWRREN